MDGVDSCSSAVRHLPLLGTPCRQLLDDDSATRPRLDVGAGGGGGRTVGGFAGTPELADRFRERGIPHCCATDLWITTRRSRRPAYDLIAV